MPLERPVTYSPCVFDDLSPIPPAPVTYSPCPKEPARPLFGVKAVDNLHPSPIPPATRHLFPLLFAVTRHLFPLPFDQKLGELGITLAAVGGFLLGRKLTGREQGVGNVFELVAGTAFLSLCDVGEST